MSYLPYVAPIAPRHRFACPECYAPIGTPKLGKDGRCGHCRKAMFRTAHANGAKWALRIVRSQQRREVPQ